MCAQYTKPMNKLSEDGFWELVDGDWIATDKQKEALKSGVAPHSKPDDNAEPVQFKPQTVSATQDEVIVNETAITSMTTANITMKKSTRYCSKILRFERLFFLLLFFFYFYLLSIFLTILLNGFIFLLNLILSYIFIIWFL